MAASYFVLSLSASTKRNPPAVFGDHLVLQRDIDLPVWGWADPGGTVTVQFNSVIRDIKAAADGIWRIDLDALPAGKPYGLIVSAGSGRKFRWVQALIEGRRTSVSASKVRESLAVRDAWDDNPIGLI